MMKPKIEPTRPYALPGLENVKRYWDREHQLYLARILPGEYYVAITNELISTVLGSCVSACIRDKKNGVGGMNHFMLPTDHGAERGECNNYGLSTRYGSYAMEHMINDILSHGGRRENLEIKLFGGGRVLAAGTDIGAHNINFVRDYLQREGLSITAENLGGTSPRKVLYFPSTGRVLMRKMPISSNDKHARREMDYQRSLEKSPVVGEVDLF